MTNLGSIYGTKIGGSNTLVIDFSNVDICGNLNINGGLTIDNNFGVSGEVLTSQGTLGTPIWRDVTPATPIFGSFDILGGNFNLTTNQYTTITALKEQTGVVANGMSVNSTTGIITLDTAGIYLLNAGFTIGQQGGGGGLNETYLYVTDSANNAIKLISEFRDEGTTAGDYWRGLTITGHTVIPAPTSPYQIMLRALGSTNGSLTSIRSGTQSPGVSILKIA